MPSEGAAKPTPRKRAKPSLWALRSPISTVAGRTASLVSLAVLLAAWCVLTYVQVERNGVMEPLVKTAFLPAPDAVLKSLFYLIFEKDLLGALAISGVRILKAFTLSIARESMVRPLNPITFGVARM